MITDFVDIAVDGSAKLLGFGLKLLLKISPRTADALFCAGCRAVARALRRSVRGPAPTPTPLLLLIGLLENPQPRVPLWWLAFKQASEQAVNSQSESAAGGTRVVMGPPPGSRSN